MTEKEKTEFAELLSSLLSSNGWTQTDLSQAIGSSQPYVSQIMNGVRTPSATTVTAIAQNMKLNPTDAAQLYYSAAKIHWPELPKLDLSKK